MSIYIDIDAMGYLRALMEAEEYSKRALIVTQTVIALNPALYTAWMYRRDILFALELDLEEELVMINEFAEMVPKNYQIWYVIQRTKGVAACGLITLFV